MPKQATYYHLGPPSASDKVPAQPVTPERLARMAAIPAELMQAAVALVSSSERYDLNRALNFAQLGAGQAIIDLLAEVEGLTASRQYGRDIINDMTLEARDLQAAYDAQAATLAATQARLVAAEAEVAGLRWVPVAEKLPVIRPDCGHSLAVSVWLNDHPANFTAFFTKSGWHRWGQAGKLTGITHWRHLDAGPAPQAATVAGEGGGRG